MGLLNPFGSAMGAQAPGASAAPAGAGAAKKGNPFNSFGEWLKGRQRPGAPERAQRVRQNAEAQFNALYSRLAEQRKAGPSQAPLSGLIQRSPTADDAVGPMQSMLEQGMQAPQQEG